MSDEGRISKPVPRGRILALTTAALVGGTLVVFAGILPAEYNIDPLGLGRLTGLSRLWAPPQIDIDPTSASGPLAREYATPFRSDVVNIPLQPAGEMFRRNEIEYKFRMAEGATLIYEWSVQGISDPAKFSYDFHGHTLTAANESMTVATYKQATGTSANGALIAPFDGIQGWFFQNNTTEPVVVTIRAAGFYTLIEPGDVGNEGGLVANMPVEKAFGEPPE